MRPQVERLADLDLLRFPAALAVVFYHLTYTTSIGWMTKFGYLGVDLFFMISGFVILWSAQGATARGFIISRFTRLYPAFWLCMAITIAAVWLLKGTIPSFAQVLANMTMVAGYAGQPYIDIVYWTLQVELKFYLIILGLITLGQIKHIEKWLMAWLVACVVDSVFELPGAARALIIAPYGPLFIAGAVFYLIRTKGVSPARIIMAMACMVLASCHAIPASESYLHGERSVLAAGLTVALFAVMACVSFGVIKIQKGALLASLSALTYPLYLLHNEIGRALAGHTGPVIAIIAVFALAWGANAIDRPLATSLRAYLTRQWKPQTSGVSQAAA